MKTLHFRAHLDMENRPLTFGYLYTGAATCTTARRPKPTRCSRLRNELGAFAGKNERGHVPAYFKEPRVRIV
jgi:hypothetical protein